MTNFKIVKSQNQDIKVEVMKLEVKILWLKVTLLTAPLMNIFPEPPLNAPCPAAGAAAPPAGWNPQVPLAEEVPPCPNQTSFFTWAVTVVYSCFWARVSVLLLSAFPLPPFLRIFAWNQQPGSRKQQQEEEDRGVFSVFEGENPTIQEQNVLQIHLYSAARCGGGEFLPVTVNTPV